MIRSRASLIAHIDSACMPTFSSSSAREKTPRPASPRRPRAARPRPAPAGKRRGGWRSTGRACSPSAGSREPPAPTPLPPASSSTSRSATAGIASSSSTYPPGIFHVPPAWVEPPLGQGGLPVPDDNTPTANRRIAEVEEAESFRRARGPLPAPSIFLRTKRRRAPRTVHRWTHCISPILTPASD